MEKLDVIASFNWMDKEERVGTLGHESLRGSDVFSFEFDESWLKYYPKIDLGRDLRPYTGVQYSQSSHIFSCFSDTLPDRWGRRLLDLRASMETEGKAIHTLSDWDYLKGVEDELRMGGFRFQNQDSGSFISCSSGYSVPPAIHIDELLQAAKEIEKSEYHHLEPEKKWVQRLFQPGSSMGGARPKACVQSGGQLYLAKFPSINDDINNTDDHFRNHAFLLGKEGWELSPAYDMNPTNSMFQALLIDAKTNDSSLNRLYNAHEHYMLDDTTARGIIMDVTKNMKHWENMAEDIGLPRREITYFTNRFEQGMEFQYGSTLHR